MWTMLTSWTTELRTLMARVHLAYLVGSLLTPARLLCPTPPNSSMQHHPWRWHPVIWGRPEEALGLRRRL